MWNSNRFLECNYSNKAEFAVLFFFGIVIDRTKKKKQSGKFWKKMETHRLMILFQWRIHTDRLFKKKKNEMTLTLSRNATWGIDRPLFLLKWIDREKFGKKKQLVTHGANFCFFLETMTLAPESYRFLLDRKTIDKKKEFFCDFSFSYNIYNI